MTPKTAKQFEKIRKERKMAIMDAALHVFAEDGYHLASVVKIAKKAGVSKGLMYNYFKSKEDLLKTLIFNIMDEIMDALDVQTKKGLDKAGFIHIIDATFDMVMKDPQFWRLYFSISIQPDVMPIIMAKMWERAEPIMTACTKYFEDNGHKDPVTMMRYYSAVVDGVQLHYMLDPEGFPIDKVKKLIVDQFA